MPAIKVTSRNVTSVPDGNYSLQGGLYLCVRGSSRQWFYRYQACGKRRMVPIGSAYDISITKAKEIVSDLATKRKRGEAVVTQARNFKKSVSAFEDYYQQIVDRIYPIKETPTRNVLSNRNRMEAIVLPTIGRLPLRAITRNHIIDLLNNYAKQAPTQVQLLRSQIEQVFAFAVLDGLVTVNPATWKNNLSLLTKLPTGGGHHHALTVSEARELAIALRDKGLVSSDLVLVTMLTASRISEVIGMRFEEIDFETATWTKPADRMKMKQEHRVPLSRQVLAILEKYRRESGLVFVSPTGRAYAQSTLLALVKDLSGDERTTIHGLRSTFRDWSAENGVPFEVAERALAHLDKSAIVRAYMRSDFLEQRRDVMRAWADALIG